MSLADLASHSSIHIDFKYMGQNTCLISDSNGSYIIQWHLKLLNPIPTGLCHVITVYGLIQPSASRNRVNILLILLLVVSVEIDSIMAKPYILQKSLLQ